IADLGAHGLQLPQPSCRNRRSAESGPVPHEADPGQRLLHAGDEAVDAAVPGHGGQRVGVPARLAEHGAHAGSPGGGIALIPDLQIALSDDESLTTSPAAATRTLQ
ncbi:MAG TPA: hypothetical protein VF516_37060, partial [Kofleriaceae bacterium]